MGKRIFLSILFGSVTAFAHPVSYKGAIGVMTWNQPFLSDYWLTYSLLPNAAIAARSMRMEMPEGTYLVYFPQVDFLAKRWNNPNSQANIYTYGGISKQTHHCCHDSDGEEENSLKSESPHSGCCDSKGSLCHSPCCQLYALALSVHFLLPTSTEFSYLLLTDSIQDFYRSPPTRPPIS